MLRFVDIEVVSLRQGRVLITLVLEHGLGIGCQDLSLFDCLDQLLLLHRGEPIFPGCPHCSVDVSFEVDLHTTNDVFSMLLKIDRSEPTVESTVLLDVVPSSECIRKDPLCLSLESTGG